MIWKFFMLCVLGVFCAIVGFGVFAGDEANALAYRVVISQ